MAKKGRRPVWGNKKDKGGKAAGVVPKYAYFAKAKLASYPNEQGLPFYLEKGQEASDFFKLTKIQKGRTAKNEEWLSRPGMGLALDAAAGDAGAAVLTERFAEDLPEGLAKTGLPGIKEALASEAGQRFAAAPKTMNVGKTRALQLKAAQEAVDHFAAFLKDNKALRKALARLAETSAILYLFSMTVLKDMALLKDPHK